MIKQLSDVFWLYARLVSGPRLVPIPFPRPARKYLGIPERSNAIDFNQSPSDRGDTRRLVVAFGASK
jgi:hypothetical protein